jgi:hypothetical protein
VAALDGLPPVAEPDARQVAAPARPDAAVAQDARRAAALAAAADAAA